MLVAVGNDFTERNMQMVSDEITSSTRDRILKQTDLYEILPFGKTKIAKLIQSGELPLLKIGNDYVTTFNILEDWIREHIGDEIYY